MKNILVGIDGSSGAERALVFAAEMANAHRATLTILAINGGKVSDDQKQFSRAEHVMFDDVLDADLQSALRNANSVAVQLNVHHIKIVAQFGDPATIILKIAEKIDADAIVVGRRGRGQLAGLILGSVSQKLATLSPCAITIVP